MLKHVKCFYVQVHDLLDPKTNKQSLKVREHNVLGPYVDGLSQLAVTSFQVFCYKEVSKSKFANQMSVLDF